MQIGKPAKQPEIKFATAKVFISVLTYPRLPSFIYLLDLRSNS